MTQMTASETKDTLIQPKNNPVCEPIFIPNVNYFC